MEVIHLKNQRAIEPSYIALGNFDGLHRGHQALLKAVTDKAKKEGKKASVLIFLEHTKNLIFGREQKLLTSKVQKYTLLERAGIDIVYEMNFTKDVMTMEPKNFVLGLLKEDLKVQGIVVGFDYRFGYKALGDVKLLKKYCEEKNLWLSVVPPVFDGEEIISSTLIRNYIASGNIHRANHLLGRDFSIRGTVIHGKKLGTKMGYPTANLRPEANYVVPKFGVYDTDISIDENTYRAATSVGTNPTLHEEGLKIEAHILNFQEMIYGKEVELHFVSFLRPELVFRNVEELFLQIKKDREKVENR